MSKNDKQEPTLAMRMELKNKRAIPLDGTLAQMIELKAARIITSSWGHRADDPLGGYGDTKRKIITGDNADILAKAIYEELKRAAADKLEHEERQVGGGKPVKAQPPVLTELPAGKRGEKSYEILVSRAVLVGARFDAGGRLNKAKKEGVELSQDGWKR